MNTGMILKELRNEASRINKAIVAIESLNGENSSKPTITVAPLAEQKPKVHVWTVAQRKAQAKRMAARWKSGEFDGRKKKK